MDLPSMHYDHFQGKQTHPQNSSAAKGIESL